MSLHNFLLFHLRRHVKKAALRASSRVPNTEKQMKALGLRPRAFICFSVFGTRDEALALVFVSFPQKRNGIVFSSGVNYLHSEGNIQSE